MLLPGARAAKAEDARLQMGEARLLGAGARVHTTWHCRSLLPPPLAMAVAGL